jgi:hypothetical protein
MMPSSSYKKQPRQPDDGMVRCVGLHPEGGESAKLDRDALQRTIVIKLAAKGFDVPRDGDNIMLDVAEDLFSVYREQSRLLESDSHLCPIDQRIQSFLDDALKTTGEKVKIPCTSVTVDRYGTSYIMYSSLKLQ